MTEAICCGEGGSWAPAGKPIVNGCRLCPRSPSYWQRDLPEPYVARPLGDDVDRAAVTDRLAAIAADETWPADLRAEAAAAGADLEVWELGDDAIVAALNARIRARTGPR